MDKIHDLIGNRNRDLPALQRAYTDERFRNLMRVAECTALEPLEFRVLLGCVSVDLRRRHHQRASRCHCSEGTRELQNRAYNRSENIREGLASDRMFEFQPILEKKWEYKGTVHQIFIDFKKAYDSVKREVLYNILIEFGIPKKLVRLIKMCLSETYSRVRIDARGQCNRALANGGRAMLIRCLSHCFIAISLLSQHRTCFQRLLMPFNYDSENLQHLIEVLQNARYLIIRFYRCGSKLLYCHPPCTSSNFT
ncbi:hypothetical protein ANN_15066 [Periplaneta americana]|uniref:Reverse transcriptase domain-containing protein n=1 Tax=Periplaneta americana TaxID=6978 RepID=A0ABQ8SY20_PERAM|nr:hypothetical protein ANN_15066 [Periplaneta americana]